MDSYNLEAKQAELTKLRSRLDTLPEGSYLWIQTQRKLHDLATEIASHKTEGTAEAVVGNPWQMAGICFDSWAFTDIDWWNLWLSKAEAVENHKSNLRYREFIAKWIVDHGGYQPVTDPGHTHGYSLRMQLEASKVIPTAITREWCMTKEELEEQFPMTASYFDDRYGEDDEDEFPVSSKSWYLPE